MSDSEWKRTPFERLEDAYNWAVKHNRVQSEIEQKGDLLYFRARRDLILAARADGKGFVMQKRHKLVYHPEKRKVAGSWSRVEERSLAEVAKKYAAELRGVYIVEQILKFSKKGDEDEYEYVDRDGVIYARVLHPPKS